MKDKEQPRNRKGAVYKINCSDCHVSWVGETGRKLAELTEHKRATRKADVDSHIAEYHRFTKHTTDYDSAQCLIDSTNLFQRLTLEKFNFCGKAQKFKCLNFSNLQSETFSLRVGFGMKPTGFVKFFSE